MKFLIYKNNYFFILYFLFFLSGAYLLLNYSKEDIFLAINHSHFDLADVFFYTITHLGSGIFYVVIIVCLLFVKYRYALIAAIGFVIISLIIQIMKHLIFSNILRPAKYFEGIEDIYIVSGLELYSFNSFPSGHTADAFGLFCLLALISSNRMLGVVYFFIALLVAFSRVYLSQHFFLDIYFGSLIGVIATVLSYLYVNGSSKLNSKSWIDKSLRLRGK